MKGFFYVSLAILLWIACIGSGLGQKVISLRDSAQVYRVDQEVDVLLDDTGALTFEDIVNGPSQAAFRPSGRSLTFGYLRSAIWLRLQLQTSQPEDWQLVIPAPFIEYLDFYQRHADHWHHSRSGYYVPHSERDFSHTGHILPLHFDSLGTAVVYIRIAGDSPKTFPVLIQQKDVFAATVRKEDIFYGIFFGILLVMFFYNFFIYLSLRQVSYVLYMGTIVCTFVIFTSVSGYAGKFLWPENPAINFYTGRMSLGVLTIILAAFTIRFLEVRTYSKVMYYLLLALMPLSVVAMLLVAFGGVPSAGNNLITVSTALYLTTGVVCRIKGNKTATFYIAAWTIYMTGGALLTLRNSGIFEFNFWTTHFVEIGAALETSIIAFALGDRYRRYKEEIEKAQRVALEAQEAANSQLEAKVEARTQELSRVNEELKNQIVTIDRQARTIEAKNAELDFFFYRISHDLRGPLSSMQGLALLAKRDVTDSRALEYFQQQESQVLRLSNIMEGLMSLTELHNEALPHDSVDMKRLVEDCIQSLQGTKNFEKVRFEASVNAGTFYGPWILLHAIFQNLIENAIKYSRPEDPWVQIRVEDHEGQLVLEVEDNGQGIPPAHQQHIFDMFYRASQHGSGSGLGLYILKRSVDRLGGTIALRSEPEKGSCFRVTLPRVPQQ